MTLVVAVCVALSTSQLIERLLESRRFVEANDVLRELMGPAGVEPAPKTVLTPADEERLRRLYQIARTRRTYVEHIELCKLVGAAVPTPASKLKCERQIEQAREQLRALDERERVIRAEGPSLPAVVLPLRP